MFAINKACFSDLKVQNLKAAVNICSKFTDFINQKAFYSISQPPLNCDL